MTQARLKRAAFVGVADARACLRAQGAIDLVQSELCVTHACALRRSSAVLRFHRKQGASEDKRVGQPCLLSALEKIAVETPQTHEEAATHLRLLRRDVRSCR